MGLVKRNRNSDHDYELDTGMDIETTGIDTETGREADTEIGEDTETVGIDTETGREADTETNAEDR